MTRDELSEFMYHLVTELPRAACFDENYIGPVYTLTHRQGMSTDIVSIQFGNLRFSKTFSAIELQQQDRILCSPYTITQTTWRK